MSNHHTAASSPHGPTGSRGHAPPASGIAATTTTTAHPTVLPQAEAFAPVEPPWHEAAAACIKAQDWSRCYALALAASKRHAGQALSADLARAHVMMGRCWVAAGDDTRAEAHFNAGLQMTRLLGDADGQLDALHLVIKLQVRQRRYDAMEQHIEAALQVMAGDGHPARRADRFLCLSRALVNHATALASRGKVSGAAMQCRRAVDLQLCVWSDAMQGHGVGRENLARAHLMLGDVHLSTGHALALLRAGRARGDLRMQAQACECLARVRGVQRRPASAVRWLSRARQLWPAAGNSLEHAASLETLSYMLAEQGQRGEAAQLQQQAQAIEHRLDAAKSALQTALTAIDTAAERQARMEAETLSHSSRLTILGSMVASISHEVLQPLSAIRLLAENALDLGQAAQGASASPLEPSHRSLSRIVELVDRMTTHVEHLKRFARREKSAIGHLQLTHLVRDALTIVEPKRKACGATLTVDVEDVTALGDMASTTAIVVNLLSNALDAVAEAGTTAVWLTCRRVGAQVRIEVRDEGRGLSADSLPHLFAPWFTTKSRDKGLGLGLALSREIAEKMGGHLEGGNHAAGGAAFCLWLPHHAPGSTLQ